jgi:hypothetical protein
MATTRTKVTTTHDPRGGGHPHLVVIETVDAQETGGKHLRYELLPGTTVIGSGPDTDVRLPGMDEHAAEIRRDSADEYVYVHFGTMVASTVDGRPVGRKMLHTGDRIVLGQWTLAFSREEFADHGRPYGGRAGGAIGHQRSQQKPRLRGTSPQGGSDAHGDDPGEYF